MMKVVAIVLCMSLLVSSQEIFGDGFGGLLALNMLSGRQPMFNLFGGAPMQQTGAGGRQGARGAQQAQAVANPFGGLTGLLVLGAL